MNINNEELIIMLNKEPYGLCKSAGKKLVIVVPKKKSKEIADDNGDPILDWEGKAIEGEGFTFRNSIASGNGALQAVRTNGNEVIIINNPKEDQEKQILEKLKFTGIEFYYADGNPDPIKKIQQALEFAVSIGCNDIYNSTTKFISEKMTTRDEGKIDLSEVEGKQLAGSKELTVLQAKRDETKQFSFIQLNEDGFLAGGPTAKGEEFKKGTIAILDNSKAEAPKVWLIEEQVFKDTYKVIQPKVSMELANKVQSLRIKSTDDIIANNDTPVFGKGGTDMGKILLEVLQQRSVEEEEDVPNKITPKMK